MYGIAMRLCHAAFNECNECCSFNECMVGIAISFLEFVMFIHLFDFLFQELHAMNVVPRLKLTEV